MITFSYDQKRVLTVSALHKALERAGFRVHGVSTEPELGRVHVHLNDGETKDPSSAVASYSDPGRLSVTSDRPAGQDGVPEAAADGSGKHVLTISKLTPAGTLDASGADVLQVIPRQMIQVSHPRPALAGGTVTVEIGPTAMAGDLTVSVLAPGSLMERVDITLRFS